MAKPNWGSRIYGLVVIGGGLGVYAFLIGSGAVHGTAKAEAKAIVEERRWAVGDTTPIPLYVSDSVRIEMLPQTMRHRMYRHGRDVVFRYTYSTPHTDSVDGKPVATYDMELQDWGIRCDSAEAISHSILSLHHGTPTQVIDMPDRDWPIGSIDKAKDGSLLFTTVKAACKAIFPN